jgi:hypothetical protein
MGTWGTSAFEDDTALSIFDDYCAELTDMGQLRSDFDTVLRKTYDLEDMDLLLDGFKEPLKVLVAAELIAAALGKPSEKLPGYAFQNDTGTMPLNLSALRKTLTDEIKDLAKAAVLKVRNTKGIHLTELWMESESSEDWLKEIDDLLLRLA